jgi:hypothetical protein
MMSLLPFHLMVQLCRWWMWSCYISCMARRLNSPLWWVLMWSSFINWVQHKAKVIVAYMWWWEPQALDLHTFIYYNTQMILCCNIITKTFARLPHAHNTAAKTTTNQRETRLNPLHCIWKSRYSIVGVGVVAFFGVPLDICTLFPPPPHYITNPFISRGG